MKSDHTYHIPTHIPQPIKTNTPRPGDTLDALAARAARRIIAEVDEKSPSASPFAPPAFPTHLQLFDEIAAETSKVPEIHPFEEAKKLFTEVAADNAVKAAGYPDGNPKTAIGARKPAFHAIPTSALIPMGQAMADGCAKYGLTNWREFPVSSSVYYNAMLRHLFAWWDGEDVADDSGVHHLGHAMACAAILLDARSVAKLNDDRPKFPGAFSRLTTEIADTGKTSLAPL